MKWSLVKKAPTYNCSKVGSWLFLVEKLSISEFEDQDKLLNKKMELISKYHHFD